MLLLNNSIHEIPGSSRSTTADADQVFESSLATETAGTNQMITYREECDSKQIELR